MGGGRSVPPSEGWGAGPDLGEEQNWGKEGGTSQPLAYHKCVLYCNIKHGLILCFLLKQVIKELLKGDSIPIFYIYPQRTCGAQIMVTNLPPPLHSFSPHRPIHLCDLIRKRTELVLTQEGLLIYSETDFRIQAHICIIDVYFFGWNGRGRDALRFGDRNQGKRGASLPVRGRTASPCRWRCS